MFHINTLVIVRNGNLTKPLAAPIDLSHNQHDNKRNKRTWFKPVSALVIVQFIKGGNITKQLILGKVSTWLFYITPAKTNDAKKYTEPVVLLNRNWAPQESLP